MGENESFRKENTTIKEKFIMLPKVDFVFKEIMRDEMVRKGFLSAVLKRKLT